MKRVRILKKWKHPIPSQETVRTTKRTNDSSLTKNPKSCGEASERPADKDKQSKPEDGKDRISAAHCCVGAVKFCSMYLGRYLARILWRREVLLRQRRKLPLLLCFSSFQCWPAGAQFEFLVLVFTIWLWVYAALSQQANKQTTRTTTKRFLLLALFRSLLSRNIGWYFGRCRLEK